MRFYSRIALSIILTLAVISFALFPFMPVFASSAPTISSFSPSSGSTGDLITIIGTNFTGATAVSFGGIPAQDYFINPAGTKIIAEVGDGSSGAVSVTTPGGTASLAGFTFVAAPVIDSFSPTSAGSGYAVVIKGSYFSGTTQVSFGGTPALNFTVDSDTQLTAVVDGGTSGVVSVTTPGGTASLAGFTFIPVPVISSFTPTSAGNGASVVITGSNFSGATGVSFGGMAALSFVINSATQITAIVGNGTSGSVSVTTPGGTGSLSGFTFIQPPNITSFQPASGGSGTTVVITGTYLSGATAVSFGGMAAASFTVDSDTQITAIVDGGATGSVSVTTPGGTAMMYAFSYYPPPTITSFSPAAAGTGTMVNIYGDNLTGATAVTFGGTPATNVLINTDGTEIVATVGSGSSGEISVTTPGGIALKAGFIFVLPPSITSFSPASAGGWSSVVIKGVNFTGASAVSFGGTSALSFTVDTDTQITAVVDGGATGAVSVTTPGGTTSLAGFTFIPLPVIISLRARWIPPS